VASGLNLEATMSLVSTGRLNYKGLKTLIVG